MALAKDIMLGGFSAQSAKCIQGQVNGAVAAAGSSQSDATALSMSVNAVASGSGGVRLPSAELNDEVDICNISGSSITVYPPTGERVNGLPTNQGFSLANNSAVKVKKFTTTRWLGNLSA